MKDSKLLVLAVLQSSAQSFWANSISEVLAIPLPRRGKIQTRGPAILQRCLDQCDSNRNVVRNSFITTNNNHKIKNNKNNNSFFSGRSNKSQSSNSGSLQ